MLLAGDQERAVAPERFELSRVAQPDVALTRFEFTEIHMAMPVRIVMFAPDSARARAAAMSAFRQIATLEATMSDYRAQSEVRRLQARVDVPVPRGHHVGVPVAGLGDEVGDRGCDIRASGDGEAAALVGDPGRTTPDLRPARHSGRGL